ncbi:Fpg/Nei family DNA glycosylase [Agromyces mediolanus]|uniref:DNA-(apurinic or apyrimidinic site) lyase n=1 Tax=Agromyces mediolanus TaxID=41986 RepID=A0A918FE54_AGRME|nr:Fpg/Nei family DNA glycosylase [Agromyces mediolanus]GGR32422.1 putative DNA glycosylase Nei [Agromyces mediolanus]GLJ74406.1 putative DNA glycosylase Nei [Agromyces mediolanus]
MPEGDTVYRAAARLREALAGRVLVRSDFRVPRYATADLRGELVEQVVSRGKHLLVRTPSWSVRSHLKMEGEWRVYAPGQPWGKPAHLAQLVLANDEAVAVGFELGEVELLPRDAEDAALARLGPDLLGEDWDPVEATARLVARGEQPIAVALLDQRVMAGLGNVYVNELCFLRGIRPERPVAEAGDPARIVELAHRLIQANRERTARVTTGVDRRGARLWVYGRAGAPCRRCGTLVERGELGRGRTDSITDPQERVIYLCPHCQR